MFFQFNIQQYKNNQGKVNKRHRESLIQHQEPSNQQDNNNNSIIEIDLEKSNKQGAVDVEFTNIVLQSFKDLYQTQQQQADQTITQKAHNKTVNTENEVKFESYIFKKLNEFFNTGFTDLKQILIYRKEQLAQKPTKITLNWKEIGEQFNINERQAHTKFDSLEAKYLDPWPQVIIKKVKKEVRKQYDKHPDRKKIKEELEKKFNLSLNFNYNSKQIENVIDYEFNKLQNENK